MSNVIDQVAEVLTGAYEAWESLSPHQSTCERFQAESLFDAGLLRDEPAQAGFKVGDFVFSARAGGTFKVVRIVDGSRVMYCEDPQGRQYPFDLDYVQSHFKAWGTA